MSTFVLHARSVSAYTVEWFGLLVNTLELWLSKQHQRRQLAELDEHLRRDLGLSDEQVRYESSRPFWR